MRGIWKRLDKTAKQVARDYVERKGQLMLKRDLKIFNISLKVSVIATALWSGILAVLLSDIINNYSLVGTREGLMNSMISMGALTALLVTIVFLGRLKKIHIIIFFGIFTSMMLIVQSAPMPFAVFLLSCFVMGFGYGTADSSQSAFLADLNRGNTAKHMGALHGIFGIGGVLTPIVLHELLKSFQWRTIYVMVGVVSLILVVQFAVVTRYMRSKVAVASRIEPKLTLAGIKEFFESRYSLYLLLCIFFGAAAQSGIIVWIIRYVSLSINSPEISAICLSIFWVTSTVSRFCSPILPVKPSQTVALGAFISAITWTVAIVINQPIIICIACGITGLASGSCIPMTLSEGAMINPEKTGLSTSILMMSKTVGQILSPIIVAFVMSLGSMQTGMYVTSALFAINGIFAVLIIRKKASLYVKKTINGT